MLDSSPDTVGNQGSVEVDALTSAAAIPTPSDPATSLLRVTGDPKQLNAWTLVLSSKGLSPLVEWSDGRFEMRVLHSEVSSASRELDAFDAEELFTQRARLADAALEERRATRHAGVGSVLVAVLLLGFFALTGPRAGGSAWFSAGASDASAVIHGEWWRTVTALTLHADGAHVLSNVGIGTLVVGAVMRSEGVGFGAALVLASGAVGNLINAWAHHTLHSSVGFSTAVFGAIGILGGLAYVRGQRRMIRLRPAWTGLAVSLALLALLGTGGERTDIFAHLFGGVAGIGLGVLVGWSNLRPTTIVGQWSAGFATAAVVMGSWLVALA